MQISLCAKIGYAYYCEHAHLLKKCTKDTCMSAIYYDQESEIEANQCKTIVTFDNALESKILDASNILILSNLQKPWTIAYKDVSRVFEIEYSTYHILNRLELCECLLTAGNYLLSQTDTNCRDMPEARDGYFTTYYAFNKIILDNAQDIAIFKSQKDYVRNKQKLSEYIHYAQMWQVLSVIFSYVDFTCNIILVITLIVFFIRYQKTMQAMLMAFITTNMSNSGIPSAKANPISRTFLLLFMIKISKEDKIVEDLPKIESMQLIVQIIMVVVCIIVAFIVLYYCCKKFRHTHTLFKYCFPFLPISRIF